MGLGGPFVGSRPFAGGMRRFIASRLRIKRGRVILRVMNVHPLARLPQGIVAESNRQPVAGRRALLREFAHLLPLQDHIGIEEFCRQAQAALATPAHRELLTWVGRGGPSTPWLAAFYKEHVEAPLVQTLEKILVETAGADALDVADHARQGIALLRAVVSDADLGAVLSPHEFAHLLEIRLGLQRNDAARNAAVAEPAHSGRRPMIRRGAVKVIFDPVDVAWNGINVPLSPSEAELFAVVVRRGRAPWIDIDNALRSCGARSESRDVLICRLRRKFADLGAANPLKTVRGWGLRFCLEPDAKGSTATWIGDSESPGGALIPLR